ncbi:hypothetical protein [Acidovorax sp.]|jgi:hypothetical protein|uniref:hypothetical protein n=1 Tax=Acidovorax sp. TaxID=1872122 RepID=UPI0025C086FF|nr:hypothetical protein [Acidovorax sp.]
MSIVTIGRRLFTKTNTIALGASVMASNALAQAGGKGKLDLPILGEFGCSLLDFFTGSLAIWAFVLIAAGTLLIGMIARIDFAKLLSVVVIFAVIQGLGAWVAPMITNADACIANNGR